MKKIVVKEGTVNNIEYQDVQLSTFLQVYNKKTAEHLMGDVYLRVENNQNPIAEFYIDTNNAIKEYYTKAYKSYFFTFLLENNNKYLVIESARFGKAFALSSKEPLLLASKDDLVEVEITDFILESGYDAPIEDENRSYFSDVHYFLKVKVGDSSKKISFYSSEIKEDYTVTINGYSILILSDAYKNSFCLIEMVIFKI